MRRRKRLKGRAESRRWDDEITSRTNLQSVMIGQVRRRDDLIETAAARAKVSMLNTEIGNRASPLVNAILAFSTVGKIMSTTEALARLHL